MDLVLIIEKDRVIIHERKANRVERTRVELNASKKPPTFDLTLEDAGQATVRGVYKFANDELTLAFTENLTKARPMAFDGKDGVVFVFKRQKGGR